MRGFIAHLVPSILLAAGGTDARAECGQNPGCYLTEGKQLLPRDPKRAAEQLLTSYKLDERTDTLILYAQALEADKQYALATETWMRIVTYRESELTAAKEKARSAQSDAARASVTRARKRAEAAAEAIIRLQPNVARVRVKLAAGPKPTVVRDGVEVDVTHEIIVNAGHDELVFTYKDGRTDKSTLALQAGENVRIDAPDGTKKVEAVAKADTKPKAEPMAKATMKPEPKAEKKPEVVADKKLESKPAQAEVMPKAKTEPKPSIVVTEQSELATSLTTTQPRSRTMARVGLGLLGGGVVAAGIAGTLGYLAHRDFDRAQAAGCSSSGECPVNTPAVDLAERSNDRARLAQLAGVGAGVLAATGITLWVLDHRRSGERRERMSLRIAPTSTTFAVKF